MVYCMSDIHGEYARYLDLLKQMAFGEEDTLYILGDVVDRGPQPMQVLLDMMARPNVIPLMGNHEYMALHCLRLLSAEITQESLAALDAAFLEVLQLWLTADGGDSTARGFRQLPPEQREAVLDYLGEFSLYEEVSAGGQQYLLLHAGLGSFSPERQLEDYTLPDLLETRTDYSRPLFPDRILVTGHTPTGAIPANPRPFYIYRTPGHIAIDCGSVFGGRLAAICLDTGEEFYSTR